MRLAVVAAVLTYIPFLVLTGFRIGSDGTMLILGLVYVVPVCLAVFRYSFDEHKASSPNPYENHPEILDASNHESPTPPQQT
jgi:hypothetical protein